MTFDTTDDLAFLPLGGTGEIGMNLNVYRLDGQLLAVDCGIGFGGAEAPEAEILVPDPACHAVHPRTPPLVRSPPCPPPASNTPRTSWRGAT